MYDTKYKIASDYDFFLRILNINKVKYKILNYDVVRMRTGGTSDKYIKSYLITTKEILNSLKKNGLNASFIKVALRAISIACSITEFYLFGLI